MAKILFLSLIFYATADDITIIKCIKEMSAESFKERKLAVKKASGILKSLSEDYTGLFFKGAKFYQASYRDLFPKAELNQASLKSLEAKLFWIDKVIKKALTSDDPELKANMRKALAHYKLPLKLKSMTLEEKMLCLFPWKEDRLNAITGEFQNSTVYLDIGTQRFYLSGTKSTNRIRFSGRRSIRISGSQKTYNFGNFQVIVNNNEIQIGSKKFRVKENTLYILDKDFEIKKQLSINPYTQKSTVKYFPINDKKKDIWDDFELKDD
ncbi:MAG: hypothetical protein HRT89_18155 [Lentisphaeria bacterium]|nr:hypothetical protein [Lentisphaeria bacterium]NQZ69981.1 hypothetical protein [Lentisphaeria bacterium]